MKSGDAIYRNRSLHPDKCMQNNLKPTVPAAGILFLSFCPFLFLGTCPCISHSIPWVFTAPTLYTKAHCPNIGLAPNILRLPVTIALQLCHVIIHESKALPHPSQSLYPPTSVTFSPAPISKFSRNPDENNIKESILYFHFFVTYLMHRYSLVLCDMDLLCRYFHFFAASFLLSLCVSHFKGKVTRYQHPDAEADEGSLFAQSGAVVQTGKYSKRIVLARRYNSVIFELRADSVISHKYPQTG